MPGKDEIPDTIKRSPAKAQRTWVAAHDSAVETYGEGRRAHMTAFAALKHSYQKVGDHWEAKDHKGPSDPRAARSHGQGGGRTYGGVDVLGSSKQQLLDLMVEKVTTDMGIRLKEILESGDPAPARLHAVIRAHIDAAITHRTFYAIIFSEEVEISEESRKLFQKWAHQRNHDFQALLDECLAAQRHPDPIDTHIAANLVLSMLNSVYRWYEPSGPVTREQLTDQITMLLKGLFPQSS